MIYSGKALEGFDRWYFDNERVRRAYAELGHYEYAPKPRTYSQAEVEDLVKRVTLRSYEAGKRARLEEELKPQPKEPLPVHRAIANSGRIWSPGSAQGQVYWVPGEGDGPAAVPLKMGKGCLRWPVVEDEDED